MINVHVNNKKIIRLCDIPEWETFKTGSNEFYIKIPIVKYEGKSYNCISLSENSFAMFSSEYNITPVDLNLYEEDG